MKFKGMMLDMRNVAFSCFVALVMLVLGHKENVRPFDCCRAISRSGALMIEGHCYPE